MNTASERPTPLNVHVKVCLYAVTAAIVFVCAAAGFFWLQSRELEVSAARSNDARLVHQFLVDLTKKCQGSGVGADKARNCGTQALANQVLVDTGDILKQTQHNLNAEKVLLDDTLPPLVASLQGFAGKAGTAATAFAGTANAATETLNTTTTTVAAAKPVLDNAAKLETDIDTQAGPLFTGANLFLFNANKTIANPNIPVLLEHVAGMSASGDHMLQTGDKVLTKVTACTLHPTFWCDARGEMLLGAQVGGYLLR